MINVAFGRRLFYPVFTTVGKPCINTLYYVYTIPTKQAPTRNNAQTSLSFPAQGSETCLTNYKTRNHLKTPCSGSCVNTHMQMVMITMHKWHDYDRRTNIMNQNTSMLKLSS